MFKSYVGLVIFFLLNYQEVLTVNSRSLQDYYFVLLVPSALPETHQYVCAIFDLAELKVCRFPEGPLLSNSMTGQTLHVVSANDYLLLTQASQHLPLLCLDYENFQVDCKEACQQTICGFGLPWEHGMAYVFDDLRSIQKVEGLIIDKKIIISLDLAACCKKNSVEPEEFVLVGTEQDDFEFDDIDKLLAATPDEEYEHQPMSYTAQKITNFFGKIAVFCFMSYHDIKQKIAKIGQK